MSKGNSIKSKVQQAEVNFRNQCMQQFEQMMLDAARNKQEEDKKTDPNAKAYVRRTEWYCLTTNDSIGITDGLNTVEAMGFTVVSTQPAGFGHVHIMGRRVAAIELGPEVPSIDGETTVTELPSLVTDEEKRKEWEANEQA